MVVYYIKKTSENLADYRYPIKEGDLCMLYDGEVIKTIYIDSERDTNSIWRDFKFIDTKSLKSYQFPTTDSILCAPIGESHAIGNTGLLTQLIQECKGEWLLDFLNETSSVLSGFVDYWDLEVLKRLTGDDEVKITYEEEDTISEFIDKPKEDEVNVEDDDIHDDDDYTDLPINYDIKRFCLSALACIEDQLDMRDYQILYDTIKGESRKSIAEKHRLTQERIRQIVVKTTKQAKELLIEQHNNLEKEKEDNARLDLQLNLMKEEIVKLKALIPKELLFQQKDNKEDLDSELVKLLETPIEYFNLPVRAVNILLFMEVKKFVDIPQIESSMKLLSERNSGKKTVHDISCLLKDFHLSFGMSYTEIVDVLIANDWHTAKRKWMSGSEMNKEIKVQDDAIERQSAVVPLVGTIKESQDEIDNVKPEEASIVLTEDIIEAARTPNGGFTKSQLAAIGIGWPPPQDWIKEKVGTLITPTQLDGFNHIEYVTNPSSESYNVKGANTYIDVASSMDDRRKMEAILQAMTHFYTPATPHDIARTISRTAWGSNFVPEETVDTFLKLIPEVEYVKWGKYILKSRNTPNGDQKANTPTDIKKAADTSDDKRIGYTVRLFPSQLKGEIIRVKKTARGIKKLVVKSTKGDIVEVEDLPYLYEVLKRN